MFDNISSKLKSLACVMMFLGIVSSIGIGIYLLTTGFILAGFLTLGSGIISTVITSFVLYGLGQLIENTDKGSVTPVQLDKNKQETTKSNIASPALNNQMYDVLGKCQMCDRDNVSIIDVEIKDEMGTRYRKVCADCFSKYNCKKIEPKKK